jgi:hypothetical protein
MLGTAPVTGLGAVEDGAPQSVPHPNITHLTYAAASALLGRSRNWATRNAAKLPKPITLPGSHAKMLAVADLEAFSGTTYSPEAIAASRRPRSGAKGKPPHIAHEIEIRDGQWRRYCARVWGCNVHPLDAPGAEDEAP